VTTIRDLVKAVQREVRDTDLQPDRAADLPRPRASLERSSRRIHE
jgi:hypothetical protein